MTAKNTLVVPPPYPVEQAIKRLGANLRTARLRRNPAIEDVAEKIETGPRAVPDAEKGKVSTGAAAYVALLWAYDLLGPPEEVADPAQDEEGAIAFPPVANHAGTRQDKELAAWARKLPMESGSERNGGKWMDKWMDLCHPVNGWNWMQQWMAASEQTR